MTALDKALAYLGWQGGTVHQVRDRLQALEQEQCEAYWKSEIAGESEAIRKRVAEIQVLLMELP